MTEIALGDGALLEHYLLQQESPAAFHVHTLAARQSRASHFTSHNLAFGGGARAHRHPVLLDAEGAECTLNGLFVGRGEQHLDNHTSVDHAKPRCVSRELYKGVLDDAARGVFHGKVIVRQDAQKTDASRPTRTCSSRAGPRQFHAGARDLRRRRQVQARLDDRAARRRGRSSTCARAASARPTARAMLTQAFAADVAERIRIPALRAEVERELGERLAGAAGEAAR